MKTKHYEFALIKVIVPEGQGESARASLFKSADDLGYEVVTSDARGVSDAEVNDLRGQVNLID